MSRTHYVRPGEGRSRVSACGVLCQAGGGPEGVRANEALDIVNVRRVGCTVRVSRQDNVWDDAS